MAEKRSFLPLDVVEQTKRASGSVVTIRPIRPNDAVPLVLFHEGLSARSVYRRYFSPHSKLTETEVDHLTHVDYDTRLALVAEQDGALIGVGRYERVPATAEAEVAFVVADEFQHLGIGTRLLQSLAAEALTHDISTFVAETLADNHEMIDVFSKSGFAVTSSRQDGTVSISFPIEPDERSLQVQHQRRTTHPVHVRPGPE
jgi:GNAT superfamily N-acetyltransferase